MSYLNHIKTATEMQQDMAAAAKAFRLAQNITQAELSARSGVAIATLRRFEAGGPATLHTLLAIAEALGALEGFGSLFALPKARSLDDLEAQQGRRRAYRAKGA